MPYESNVEKRIIVDLYFWLPQSLVAQINSSVINPDKYMAGLLVSPFVLDTEEELEAIGDGNAVRLKVELTSCSYKLIKDAQSKAKLSMQEFCYRKIKQAFQEDLASQPQVGVVEEVALNKSSGPVFTIKEIISKLFGGK